MTYLRYLHYILRHKWYVFVECCKLGIPWLGVIHDWSKLLPSEFLPYAQHFYGGKHDTQRDSTGYYKPVDTGDLTFDWAWFLHAKRNKHHWQWWVLPTGDPTEDKVLRMPMRYRKEMLADWRGAGKALGTPNTRAWWYKHAGDMRLDLDTRTWIITILEGGDGDPMAEAAGGAE